MKYVIGFIAVFFVLNPSNIFAQKQIYAGPQVSSLGPGISAEMDFGRFSISSELGWIPINSIAFDAEDLDYLINTDFFGGLILANLGMGQGRFSMGAGLMIGGYNADGSAENLRGNVEIGNGVYDSADIGELLVDLDFGGVAPALMLGVRGGGFNFGIGAAITGAPKYSLSATGSLKSNASFIQDTILEAEDIADVLDKIPVLPLIRLGWQKGF